MLDFDKQFFNPSDDEYIDTGVNPVTGEVSGMSGDTTPEFRAKLDQEYKDQLFLNMEEENDSSDILKMADRLVALKEQKKKIDEELKEITSAIDELELNLSDSMTEAELDSFSRNGKTFYLKTRLFASAKAGGSDELIAALKEHGNADLVKETVNSNTLSAFTKEQKELHEDTIPEWLDAVINVFEKVSVGIRKK